MSERTITIICTIVVGVLYLYQAIKNDRNSNLD